MGFSIEDGSGNGYQAKVNSRNMLTTIAVSQSMDHYENENGNVYSMVATVTPDSTANCFCYIKNIGDVDIVIQRVSMHTNSDEVINTYINDVGSPVGGISYTAINRNAGSTNLSDSIIYYGQDITGLSGGKHFDSFYVSANNCTYNYRWQSGVIISKNRIFTLYAVNGNIEINFTMSFYHCTGN